MPHLYFARNYMHPIRNSRILDVCKSECRFLNLPCDKDVYELCDILTQEKNLQLSDDPYNNIDIYIALRNEINTLL